MCAYRYSFLCGGSIFWRCFYCLLLITRSLIHSFINSPTQAHAQFIVKWSKTLKFLFVLRQAHTRHTSSIDTDEKLSTKRNKILVPFQCFHYSLQTIIVDEGSYAENLQIVLFSPNKSRFFFSFCLCFKYISCSHCTLFIFYFIKLILKQGFILIQSSHFFSLSLSLW